MGKLDYIYSFFAPSLKISKPLRIPTKMSDSLCVLWLVQAFAVSHFPIKEMTQHQNFQIFISLRVPPPNVLDEMTIQPLHSYLSGGDLELVVVKLERSGRDVDAEERPRISVVDPDR